jgi:hypothetical protein
VENGDGGDGAAEMMVALRIPVMLVLSGDQPRNHVDDGFQRSCNGNNDSLNDATSH